MTDATHNQLEQAYRFINNDELDKALRILKPIVAAQPDNADAWWLLANAVNDQHEAKTALDNVLRLNPNHPSAREHRDALLEAYPDLASGAEFPVPLTPLDDIDDLFGGIPEPAGNRAEVPDFGSLDDETGPGYGSGNDSQDLFSTGSGFQTDGDFGSAFGDADSRMDSALQDDPFGSMSAEPDFLQEADIEPAAKPARAPKKPKPVKVKEPPVPLDPLEIERRANSRTSPFVRILAVLLVILVIGGGIGAAYLSGVFGNRGGAGQTPVPVTAVAFQPIIDVFTTSNYQGVQAAVVPSSLGDTLQVQVCGVPGPSLQAKVNQAMDMIATEAAKMRDTIKAAGVQVVSCAKPDVKLYRAVVPISAVTAYVDGKMQDRKTFRAAWKTT